MGRTKPLTTSDHNNSFGKAELMVLRKNNQSIAKLLSQTKEELRMSERQLLALQEENMGLMVENRNLSRENRRLVGVNETLNVLLRNVYQASKAQMPHLEKLVETFTYILCETGKSVPIGSPMSQEVGPQFKLIPPSPHSSVASPTKRQAVKPMVSGHIIHRPTVNLPRLATEELARLAADVAHSSSGDPDDEANGEYITAGSENEYEANNDGDDNDGGNESPPPDSPGNQRLDTLQEVEENVSSMNTIDPQFGTPGGSAPFLSGVFRDVNLKVFVTPLPNIPAHVSRQLSSNRPTEIAAEQSTSSAASTSARETPERSVGRPSVSRRSGLNGAGLPSKRRGSSVDFPLSSPPHITKRKRTSPLGRRTMTPDQSTAGHSTLVNAGSVDEDDEDDKTVVNENGAAVKSDVATTTESESEDNSKKIETLSVLGLSPLKYTSTPCTSHSSFRKSLEAYTPTTPIPANARRRRKSFPRRPSCKVMMKQLALPARRSKSPPREKQEDIDAGSSSTAVPTPEKRHKKNVGRRTRASNSEEKGSSDEQMSPAWTPYKQKKKQSSKPKKQQKMPTCKVMVKQLSLLKKKSLSPLKVPNDDGTRRKSSTAESPGPRVSPRKSTPRKSTPKKLGNSGRPMRAKRPTSLKEQPLNHKLRREK